MAVAPSELEAVRAEVPRHESAHLHVSGRALYADDIPLPADALHAAFGLSTIAHGRIRTLDLAPVARMPGVQGIARAADVPGENNYSAVRHDDPIFADALVQYVGQPLFAVAARSYTAARRAARSAHVEYEALPAILDIRAALAADSYVLPSARCVRGEPQSAIARAPHRLRGTATVGGQDHFYLEGQIAVAMPRWMASSNSAFLPKTSTAMAISFGVCPASVLSTR